MNDALTTWGKLDRRSVLAGMAGLCGFGLTKGAAASTVSLRVESRVLDVLGKPAKVFGIVGPDGKQGLNQLLAPQFSVRLANAIAEPTLVHWHGLVPPLSMDGTPMLSGPLLAPGEARDYVFSNNEAGTHWMHSHVGLQEQQLLAAPLIIRETGAPLVDEQEHVVMLHDFTFRDPQEILSELQGGGGGHAAHAGHAMREQTSNEGHDNHGAMASGPAMLNDIIYDAMLANDRTLDDPEIVTVDQRGRLRLRIINACAASNQWIDLGGIQGALIAVDGKTVKPVTGNLFPLAVAQRADIRIELPRVPGTWPILFRAEGSTMQSGIVLRQGNAPVAKISRDGDVTPALTADMETQLQSLAGLPDLPVERTEMLMLTGGGADYLWGLNGKPAMHDVLFTIRSGKRYRVMMHNMTTMAHPMHLHGHYFKVVAVNGKQIDGAIRDTVLVPVGATVTIQFDANNPGTWAFHCHHLYHMNSGMMGALAYEDAV